MRIRKNAKLSSILLSASSHASPPETLQTHVCQLNQSPWDAITFSQESFQFEGDDSFTGNGSLGDSFGAVESVASMMEGEDKAVMVKVDDMVIDDNDIEEPDKMFDDNEPNFSYNSSSIANSLRKPNKALSIGSGGSRRGRARAAKKGSSSASNPYEFYYYSGFGPLWGKRRGERVRHGKKLMEVKEMENNSSEDEKTPPFNNAGLDYVEDDDDEEDEDNTGKKRMRKPIKARSLKSLM